MSRLRRADVSVVRADHLSPDEVSEVLSLTGAAGDADGAYPLSEHVTLHLRHGGDRPVVHLLVRHPSGLLVGYAHVDTTDAVEGASAELCVHPLHRRRGLGRALVLAAIEAAEEHDGGHRLRLWAHGDHPSANALALSLGFGRARVLWQMRRSLFAPVPAPSLPAGIVLRSFRPGADDETWLALNTRAFAAHPEQGRWTLADLRVRLAEDWFDPAGFLLAERTEDSALLGFHWTKVHGTIRHEHDGYDMDQRHHWAEHDPHHHRTEGHHHEDEPASQEGEPASRDHEGEHDHDPIGEVYVLGVDPSAHGLGLGTALTLAGLRHLRAAGLDQVMLYVDETNTQAIALYQRLGFARWSTDVCFRRPGPQSLPSRQPRSAASTTQAA